MVAFIERARDRGATDEFTANLLKHSGWSQRDINLAFFHVYERLTGYSMPVPPAGDGTSAKEAASYLLSFSMLGLWSYALGEIAFIGIDRIIPDATQNNYGSASYQLAFSLARLIVAYPVYLWTMRSINRALARHRENYFSIVRRWLTYLTLLIVVLMGVGTLIAFLTSFLTGELTVRFALKAAVVLAINGAILRYYTQWLQRTAVRSSTSSSFTSGAVQ